MAAALERPLHYCKEEFARVSEESLCQDAILAGYCPAIAVRGKVPPVNTASSGSFSAHYYTSDYGYLKWKLNLYNVKDVIKAHIHLGGVGQEGDVAVVLFDTSKSPFSSKNVWFTGKIYAADLTGPLAGKHVSDLLDYIKNGQAYVNVHTQAWPEGAIRGQLEYY
ncbi:hypothetical protein N2152v2_001414 [Parachlorella kessleri]